MVGSAKPGRLTAARGVSALLALLSVCTAADPTLSLSDASDRVLPDYTPLHEGSAVVVSGQVSARPSHIVGRVHVAIQDRRHGLILECPASTCERLTPGDWVEAQGHIIERWGLPVVAISKGYDGIEWSASAACQPEPGGRAEPGQGRTARSDRGHGGRGRLEFRGRLFAGGACSALAQGVYAQRPGCAQGFAGIAIGEIVRAHRNRLPSIARSRHTTISSKLLIGDVSDVVRLVRRGSPRPGHSGRSYYSFWARDYTGGGGGDRIPAGNARSCGPFTTWARRSSARHPPWRSLASLRAGVSESPGKPRESGCTCSIRSQYLESGSRRSCPPSFPFEPGGLIR